MKPALMLRPADMIASVVLRGTWEMAADTPEPAVERASLMNSATKSFGMALVKEAPGALAEELSSDGEEEAAPPAPLLLELQFLCNCKSLIWFLKLNNTQKEEGLLSAWLRSAAWLPSCASPLLRRGTTIQCTTSTPTWRAR